MNDDSLEIVQEVLPDDRMYSYAPWAYFEAGREALRCVRLAMLAARLDTVTDILDFGSGGGRVLRHLKAAFPEARLTACDMHEQLVAFCTEVLGATGVVSDHDPSKIKLGGRFDLIWSGSVFTHVDQQRWTGFLKLFESVLTPGGVAVFTAYGRDIEALVRSGKNMLNLSPERARRVLKDYDAKGFGYHKTDSDGDCLASPAWVCNTLMENTDLDLLLYLEHGWLRQDVIACAKRGGPVARLSPEQAGTD